MENSMARKWTDEEVQAEIKAAVAIVNEDRERATYQALHGKYGQEPPKPGNPNDPTPPPPKPGDPDPEPAPKKKSLWWGDALGDSDE
jgi:hypothetical protein